MHANDIDTLPAGLALARRSGARLVYDAHELYSEFEAPAPRLAQQLTLALERRLARRADTVVTVSDHMARELQARLGLRAQPLVVTNAPRRTTVEPREFEDGPLRVVYQGGSVPAGTSTTCSRPPERTGSRSGYASGSPSRPHFARPSSGAG